MPLSGAAFPGMFDEIDPKAIRWRDEPALESNEQLHRLGNILLVSVEENGNRKQFPVSDRR